MSVSASRYTRSLPSAGLTIPSPTGRAPGFKRRVKNSLKQAYSSTGFSASSARQPGMAASFAMSFLDRGESYRRPMNADTAREPNNTGHKVRPSSVSYANLRALSPMIDSATLFPLARSMYSSFSMSLL